MGENRGVVIVRQRPGTAKGFFFLTLEDETGISNAIVIPDLFQANRALLHNAAILMVEGVLQKQDGVVAIRARTVQGVAPGRRPAPSTISADLWTVLQRTSDLELSIKPALS